jgi:5-methylcytosine-specific restriction enzyme A
VSAAVDRALGHARSTRWPAVEHAHLQREGWCRHCGGTARLQVHHVAPFHLHPELELDDSNLITLCEDSGDGVECHLHVGHLGNWKNFNPAVRAVATSPGPGVPAPHLVEAA